MATSEPEQHYIIINGTIDKESVTLANISLVEGPLPSPLDHIFYLWQRTSDYSLKLFDKPAASFYPTPEHTLDVTYAHMSECG